MKNMFYNYDHHIENTDNITTNCSCNNETLSNSCCVKKLLNAKGEELGISAKENSTFPLYFEFDCNEDNYALLADDKSSLHFEVLDFKREQVATFPVTLSSFANEAVVNVTTSSEGPLKYGNYKMHLYLEVVKTDKNGEDMKEVYTLFSPEDAILNIE